MTAVAQPMAKPAKQSSGWLNVLIVWHVLVAIGAAAGLYGLFTNQVPMPDWVRWFSIGALLLIGLGSIGAVIFIPQRDHRGRTLSLMVNYIGFLFCAVAFLQLIGAFAGFDELADRFPRSLPFLGISFVGYLIYAFADRYENYPKRQRAIHRVGNIVMVAGLLMALVALIGWESVPQFVQERLDPVILAMLAGTVLFGLMCWAMWRRPAAQAMQVNNARQEAIEGYLFLSPNLIGFLLFLAGPLLLSLYTSFTNWDGFGTRDFIGLANYGKLLNLTFAQLVDAKQPANQVLDVKIYDELLRFSLFGGHYLIGAADKLFWIALRNTFLFGILVVPLAVIPALCLAAVLNSKLPGMKFFRSVYFIPSVAAVVGVALIWQWMYNSSVGWINFAISERDQPGELAHRAGIGGCAAALALDQRHRALCDRGDGGLANDRLQHNPLPGRYAEHPQSALRGRHGGWRWRVAPVCQHHAAPAWPDDGLRALDDDHCVVPDFRADLHYDQPGGRSQQRHALCRTLPLPEWLPALQSGLRVGDCLAALPDHLRRHADPISAPGQHLV